MKNLKKLVILLAAVLCMSVMASCQKRVAVDIAPPTTVDVTESISIPAYLSQPIHFAFDKYNITQESRQILDAKIAFMKQNPAFVVTIEGHTDERGTYEYNMALGERRANAAKKYMVDNGINPSRIMTVSYGETRPVDPRSNEEAWAKNRRAEFIFKY